MTWSSSAPTLLGLVRSAGFADRHIGVEAHWPAVKQWLTTPVEHVSNEDDWTGFECTRTPSPDEREEWPQPPEELPPGEHVAVTVFRLHNSVDPADRRRQTEVGIEWWFAADEDWVALRRREDWDDHHPVSFHFWAASGPTGKRAFIAQVEATSMFVLARRKPAVLARVFGFRSSEEITATGQ